MLFEAGLMADVDLAPGDMFNKKIRNAQLSQYNYIFGKSSLGRLDGRSVGWPVRPVICQLFVSMTAAPSSTNCSR